MEWKGREGKWRRNEGKEECKEGAERCNSDIDSEGEREEMESMNEGKKEGIRIIKRVMKGMEKKGKGMKNYEMG